MTRDEAHAMTTDEMVEAAARSDAEFDKRGWLEMPKHERERYLARARKSITAANAAAWRPIEEAPRDRAILLAAYIVPSDEAQRNGSQPSWHIEVGRAFGTKLDRWTNVIGERPTHWQPLPAPPPQQEGE